MLIRLFKYLTGFYKKLEAGNLVAKKHSGLNFLVSEKI